MSEKKKGTYVGRKALKIGYEKLKGKTREEVYYWDLLEAYDSICSVYKTDEARADILGSLAYLIDGTLGAKPEEIHPRCDGGSIYSAMFKAGFIAGKIISEKENNTRYKNIHRGTV